MPTNPAPSPHHSAAAQVDQASARVRDALQTLGGLVLLTLGQRLGFEARRHRRQAARLTTRSRAAVAAAREQATRAGAAYRAAVALVKVRKGRAG